MIHLRLAAPLAALLLAGCVSFGPKVPDMLLRLTPEAPVAVGGGASGSMASAIIVLEPHAEQRLDVQRVPVQVDGVNVAYLKQAMWVEQPARLFQRLLAETIRTTSGRLVLEEDPGDGNGLKLSGRLLDMGYDAPTSSAIVRFEALRQRPGGQIETRRFESVVPGVQAKATPVGVALNRAANDVARQVAAWVG